MVTVTIGAVLGAGLVPVGAAGAPAEPTQPVGVITTTFVDRSRPTDANGACKKIRSRTLPTTIYYPATSGGAAPTPDAPPDTAGGPYPLIVFAHGYSATPQTYAALLQHWASQGFVVAAPQFPLSSGASPCGAVAGDSVHQPQDVSFVISSVLARSARHRGPLAGLVNRHRIGAAGHSNGAITMYGVVANTALRDRRIDAAAVLAGTAQRYPKGGYDFSKAPPLLFVHGSDDSLIPYEGGVEGFNRARGPKGLLTVVNGDHGSSAALSGPAAPAVMDATTDFFDAFLRHDAAAKRRLPKDQVPGVTEMRWVGKRGSTTTIPTVPAPKIQLKASAKPVEHLTGGQQVTVTWSGYTPGKVVNILQCNGSDRDLGNPSACDYTHAHLLLPNPTGAGSVQLEMVEGRVGDGSCDAEHPKCLIVVNNASSPDPKDSVRIDISFAP